MSDLTGPRFETQTSRYRGERVTARPTNYRNYLVTAMATVNYSNFEPQEPYVFVDLLLFFAVDICHLSTIDICQQMFRLR